MQTLLFFGVINGKEVSGITDRDLLLSVSFAAANSLFSVFELFAESRGVRESFVQYSLHCITARHGWVPFADIIGRFLGGEDGDYALRGNSCWNKLFGLRAIPKDAERKRGDENELDIDYNMMYRLPLLSWLSGEKLTVSISYSFSPQTLKSLMAILQTKKESASDAKSPSGSFTPSRRKLTAERKTLSMKFRKSLDLLSVRQIVHLMQCCHSQGIKLPDIHEVDWPQIFKNTPIEEDPRLYSNTFDEDSRPLLISLYLTNYDNNNWQILREFIALDTPINVADNDGSTLLHHMLKRNDWRAIRVLFSALKWNQRINFDQENDERNIIILEMIKMYKVKGLKEALNALKPRQQINFAVRDQSGDSMFHHLVRGDDVGVLRNVLRMIQSHYNDHDKLNLSVSNNNDESVIALALNNDAERLTKVDREREQELNLDLPDIAEEDDDDDDDEDDDDHDEDHGDDDDGDDIENGNDDVDDVENGDEKANGQMVDITEKYDRQFEIQWERFEDSWLKIQDRSRVLDPRVLVNVLYLKFNGMIATLPQQMDFQERMAKIKWLRRKIRAISKNEDLKDTVRAILRMEISAKRLKSRQNEEARNRAILSGFKRQYDSGDLESKMMHFVLLKHGDIMLYNHRFPQKSVLGFVLVRFAPFYEYFEIVNRLQTINSNIKLMTHEIPIFVKLYEDAAANAYSSAYFALFEKVCSILSV